MLAGEQRGVFRPGQRFGNPDLRRPGVHVGQFVETPPVVRYPRRHLAAHGRAKFGVAIRIEERVGRNGVRKRLELPNPPMLRFGNGQILRYGLGRALTKITQPGPEQPGHAVVAGGHESVGQGHGGYVQPIPPKAGGANGHRPMEPDILMAVHIHKRRLGIVGHRAALGPHSGLGRQAAQFRERTQALKVVVRTSQRTRRIVGQRLPTAESPHDRIRHAFGKAELRSVAFPVPRRTPVPCLEQPYGEIVLRP